MSDHLNPHLLDHEWNRFSAWLTEQGHDPTLPVDPTYVAAYRVSLSEGYSGHSPRIGKALDLVQENSSVAQILQAGRWHSPDLIPYFRPSGESRDSEEQLEPSYPPMTESLCPCGIPLILQGTTKGHPE